MNMNHQPRALIVEDDEEIRKNLANVLHSDVCSNEVPEGVEQFSIEEVGNIEDAIKSLSDAKG